jgi:spore germination protein YaaH
MRISILLLGVVLSLFAIPAHAYRMSAWVPSWDSSAPTILGVHSRDLDETNPGWLYANADGTVRITGEDARLRAALAGTLLMPTLKNYVNGSFDGAMMTAILNSDALREKHADAIAQLVVQNGYDGVDVDYERLTSSAKAGFTTFIQLLGGKLHASNKKLSVTLSVSGGGQDWTAVGAVADSVKIMAYDYHWSTSAAGPISPLDWLDQIATSAERAMPAQKVMIGLPWYGYDWLGTAGSAVTYAQAMTRAQSSGINVGHDANGEATYTYDNRTVFFQDAESYRRKVQSILAKHSGIGGFAHWRVGAEDPAIWEVVSQLHSGGSAPTTTIPPKDFMIDGPLEVLMTAGTQSSARYSFVGINGFTGPVTVTAQPLDAFKGSVTVSGTSLLFDVSLLTAAGNYRVALTMAGSGISHETVVVLRVSAPKVTKHRAAR